MDETTEIPQNGMQIEMLPFYKIKLTYLIYSFNWFQKMSLIPFCE